MQKQVIKADVPEAGATFNSPVTFPATKGARAEVVLNGILGPLGLDYVVKDGLLTVTAKESVDRPLGSGPEAGLAPVPGLPAWR